MVDKKVLTENVEKMSKLHDKITDNLLDVLFSFQNEIDGFKTGEVIFLITIVCSSFTANLLGEYLYQTNINDINLEKILKISNDIIKDRIKKRIDQGKIHD
jgi:hypothetical protein